jgi:hypothetical protein
MPNSMGAVIHIASMAGVMACHSAKSKRGYIKWYSGPVSPTLSHTAGTLTTREEHNSIWAAECALALVTHRAEKAL